MKKQERRINTFDYHRLKMLYEDLHKTDKVYFAELLGQLKASRLIEQKMIPSQVITMNSTVLVQNMQTREKMEFTLVYPEDAAEEQNRISILDPLGAAVLGFGVGETIHYASPQGSVWLKIEQVTYQPEAAGNYAM